MTFMQVGITSLYQRVTLRKLVGIDIVFALICLLLWISGESAQNIFMIVVLPDIKK